MLLPEGKAKTIPIYSFMSESNIFTLSYIWKKVWFNKTLKFESNLHVAASSALFQTPYQYRKYNTIQLGLSFTIK